MKSHHVVTLVILLSPMFPIYDGSASLAAKRAGGKGNQSPSATRAPVPAAGLLGSKHDFAPPDAPLVEHCAACHGRPPVSTRPSRPPSALAQSQPYAATSISAESDMRQQLEEFFSEELSPDPKSATQVAASQPMSALRDTRAVQFRRGSIPGGATVLCLSCHDGTLAGFIASGPAAEIHVSPRARTEVQHDHPVGVRYPRIDRGYRPAASVLAAGVPLPDGRVECVSCHDPHDAWGQPHMLVTSNRRSALCLTCHIK